MAYRFRWKKFLCCCIDSPSDKATKKKLREHKYCGCKESRKQRSKMRTCDFDIDRTSLVENEVVEALEYDFGDDTSESREECLIEAPVVPFNYVLRNPLRPHSDIIIQGVLKDKTYRFAINFVMTRFEEDEIAFHLNPRLDLHYCARNSFINGKWDYEEGNSQQPFPFKQGEPFQIEIFLTHAEFMVAVNGIHFCSYTYRTSILNITSLQVWGGVSLLKVHITRTSQYPVPLAPEIPPTLYRFTLKDNSITENTSRVTPVYATLPGNLRKDSKIEIKGKVKLLPFSFYINLQEGNLVWPHPVIPLHISVRFLQDGDYVTLANAWLEDSWGHEELVHKNILFSPGYPFTVSIEVLEEAFVVKVDQQLLLSFTHRSPYNTIDTLHIQGDVFIYDIELCL